MYNTHDSNTISQEGAVGGTSASKAFSDAITFQKTLVKPVRCTGVGLHSGLEVTLWLKPAAEDAGITFVRTDVTDRPNRVEARHDNVVDTRLCTMIGNMVGVTVSTIEHLMAALWACGVDNVTVELDGPEVPVMDGSAAPFIFLMECAGTKEQESPQSFIQVLEPVEVLEDGKSILIEPADDFSIDFTILYPGEMIHNQNCQFDGSSEAFRTQLSRARTYGFKKDIDWLRDNGLAKGGSLSNAVVIDGDQVLNQGGFRYDDECVRHKALDCVGDLYLAGAPLKGKVTASCSGHMLNNKLLHALLSQPEAFVQVGGSRRRALTATALA